EHGAVGGELLQVVGLLAVGRLEDDLRRLLRVVGAGEAGDEGHGEGGGEELAHGRGSLRGWWDDPHGVASAARGGSRRSVPGGRRAAKQNRVRCARVTCAPPWSVKRQGVRVTSSPARNACGRSTRATCHSRSA